MSRGTTADHRSGATGLVRSSGWSFGGQLARAAFNAGLFVLAARVLGVDGFGGFASSVALVALAMPFANLGAMSVMIRRNAHCPGDVAVDYCSAIVVTVFGGVAVAGLLAIVNELFDPIGIASSVVVVIAIGDLVGYRLSELSGAALQSRDCILGTAFFPALVTLGRLAGVLITWYLVGNVSVGEWAISYSAWSVAIALLVVLGVGSVVGFARPRPLSFLRQWREGLLYSVGLSAQGVYNDIDKVMLAGLSSLESAGLYAAAYRLIDLAFVPMRAVLSVTYVRFFRAGTAGAERPVALAVSLLRPSLALSAAASLILFAGADLLPLLLGPGYADVVWITRLLAVIPVLRTLHYLAADSLTGAGRQRVRTAWQVGTALVNVAINFMLIPVYGIYGAIASSILADLGLAVALWWAVLRLRRRAPTGLESSRTTGHPLTQARPGPPRPPRAGSPA
jgi:O-antigen/teichoic acid export membrane protein